jgi:antitoxin component YwqK of YwqJK toxin-antitoxin module
MVCINKCTILSPILYTILFISLFVSCERTREPNTEITTKNGLIYRQGETKPFTGTVKDTVEGKLIEYEVVDGKKNGTFKIFHKNGKIAMIGQIIDNLNQGKWQYYYPSGQIESEGTFKDDLPDGNWKWFYENGNLKEKGSYIHGNREGCWILYNADGNKKEERILQKNMIIEKKKLPLQ